MNKQETPRKRKLFEVLAAGLAPLMLGRTAGRLDADGPAAPLAGATADAEAGLAEDPGNGGTAGKATAGAIPL